MLGRGRGRKHFEEHVHLYRRWPTDFFACTDFPVKVGIDTVLEVQGVAYAPVLCYEGNCIVITLDERGAKVFAPVIEEDSVDRTVDASKNELAGTAAR